VAAHAARTLAPAQQQASCLEMAATLDAADSVAAGDPSPRGGRAEHSGGVPMSGGGRNRLLHKAVHRAAPRPELVELRDGAMVFVRQVQRTDAELLADGFTRLSSRSRQLRFLIGKNALSAKELHYFTDIDHHDHEALGAIDVATGRGVGVARFIRAAGDPASADVAITVVDEWQGRGVGIALMTRLACRAQEEGIRYFSALVAADNAAVLGLLRRLDADVDLMGYEHDTVSYEISLRPRKPCVV
jgi:ribosomal protein S18 acetylase RimI-like enzyme